MSAEFSSTTGRKSGQGLECPSVAKVDTAATRQVMLQEVSGPDRIFSQHETKLNNHSDIRNKDVTLIDPSQ